MYFCHRMQKTHIKSYKIDIKEKIKSVSIHEALINNLK